MPPRTDRTTFGQDRDARELTLDYARRIADAAEAGGFDSVMLVASHRAWDPWVLASSVAAQTGRIKFVVTFRAGYSLPTLVAQQIETFEHLYPGRLYLNVATGSEDEEQRAYGDVIAKVERYRRTDEFLEVLRNEFAGPSYDFDGDFYEIRGGGGRQRTPHTLPKVFFGGLSPEAEVVSARSTDVQLMYGETPPMAAENVKRISDLARAHGRDVEFGIRIQVIARPTSAQAWEVADRFLAGLTPELIDQQQESLRRRRSVGQERVQSLHTRLVDDSDHDLLPHPNVWAGPGLVEGGGASTALVGSYDEVAERIAEYQEIGIRHFMLSGTPLLEEAQSLGENLLPRLSGSGSAR
jgi:alkanesulfonate monooxygenase